MSEYIKRNRHRVIIMGLLLISIAVWSAVFRMPDGSLHIKVFDVGQGDSIFIRTPSGYKILIDGGSNDKVLDYLGKQLPFFDKTLDLVVLTHPQSDHLAGLIEVAKRYEIKRLWVSYSENDTAQYSEWENVLGTQGLEGRVVWSGDQLIFSDNVVLQVQWPREESASDDLNTTSIVILIDYKDFEGLLTGDADNQVQPYTESTSEVEFLKVPHHGAKTALDKAFTSKLSPEISVISVGSRNRYGHPAQNTIDLLKSLGSELHRTDEDGTVEIVTDGSSWYTKIER